MSPPKALGFQLARDILNIARDQNSLEEEEEEEDEEENPDEKEVGAVECDSFDSLAFFSTNDGNGTVCQGNKMCLGCEILLFSI